MTAQVDRPTRIAVIGASDASAVDRELARAVGRAVAEAGCVLLCGGRSGVAEAACRGAVEAGGLTVGFLPGTSEAEANPWVCLPLPTGLGEARNVLVAGSAQAVIAVGGSTGTLSEMAFALTRSIPVVALRTWALDPARCRGCPPVTASHPEDAVRLALARVQNR